MTQFENREEAGILLAEKLKEFKNKSSLVLGIPRGGVLVAKKIADQLGLPLDIIAVKKIPSPYSSELAIGAVGPKKTVYWDEELCRTLRVTREIRNKELRIKEKEREERERILRGGKIYNFRNKTVILVDDGVATGATVLVSQKFLKAQKAKKIILAVPVISKETLGNIKQYFDSVITLSVEEEFMAVGQFYRDFPQVTDEEVIDIIKS